MDRPSSTHHPHPLPGPHYRASLPVVRLEIRRGRAKNLVRHIRVPVYLIGTARDCDLVLGDPQFPEVHAYLFVSEAGVSLRHIGDGPEVTVDGRAVRNTPLGDGQRIRTGPFEFVISVDSPDGGPGGRAWHQTEAVGSPHEQPGSTDTIARIERLLANMQQTLGNPTPQLRLYTGPGTCNAPAEIEMIEPVRRREPA